LSDSTTEVADFFPAQLLYTIFIFLLAAYRNVMFSKISSVSEWKEVIRVQKKSLLPLGILIVAIGIATAGAGLFIPLIVPAAYAGTAPSAVWLFLSLIFSVIGLPAGLLLMYVKRLWAATAANLLSIPILVLFSILWVPRWGAPGAAAAHCVAIGFTNLGYVIALLLMIRKGDPRRSK
ncbi:MAG: lipopolysaccharide biosynthesis protein, partial [Planctomycetota bacterium]